MAAVTLGRLRVGGYRGPHPWPPPGQENDRCGGVARGRSGAVRLTVIALLRECVVYFDGFEGVP